MGSPEGILTPIADPSVIESEWRTLEEVADGSFFLSWGWIGPWLRVTSRRAPLFLFRCTRDGRTIGLAVLSRCVVRRGHGVVRSRQLQLNEHTGLGLDMIVEYNGILATRGQEGACWSALAGSLGALRQSWDELRARSLDPRQLQAARAAFPSLRPDVEREVPSWVVPLAPELASEERVLASFKKKTRQQMRQTIREFAEIGGITIDTPRDVTEALRFFDAMGELHSARWKRVGGAGSFANADWVAFHRDVIAQGVPRGDVVLTRTRVGSEEVGYVYGYRWRGTFVALQTGFRPQERPGLRSGYLSHLRTMQWAAASGVGSYDLLPDDSASYKRLLAEPSTVLTTVHLQRARLRFAAMRVARALLVRFRRPEANSSPPNTETAA
jgi:CelD/BcsL family acetyltransferase involved in cellulose biosynthesis